MGSRVGGAVIIKTSPSFLLRWRISPLYWKSQWHRVRNPRSWLKKNTGCTVARYKSGFSWQHRSIRCDVYCFRFDGHGTEQVQSHRLTCGPKTQQKVDFI